MIDWRAVVRSAAVLVAYLAITAVYTHPLLSRLGDGVANDRYDPVLNASILWWNATTVPFSTAWWTPPHYYPSEGIAAFTENLVGLSPITTPIIWATRNALVTYNIAFFLTWALSAFTVYLLAVRIGAGGSAAFVAGLAFGFAPYRISQMGHLQVLASFWLPLALVGLHGYLQRRQKRWLVLFGAAWVLQSLSNGYFMLFGAVLIGMWLVYFCSTSGTWRAAGPVLVAWALASLPLLPVMLVYRRIHDAFGLVRELPAMVHYSATPVAWLRASPLSLFWGDRLPDGGSEWNLFPGATAVLLVAAAIAWTLKARPRVSVESAPAAQSSRRRLLITVLTILAALSTAVVLSVFIVGPWRVTLAGLPIRVSSIGRPLLLASTSLLLLRIYGGRWRPRGERSPFAFYTLATVAAVVLSMGPQIKAGDRVILNPAPYGWLMILPGFDGLRVPTRFWMVGALCLATATALAFHRLAPTHRGARLLLAGVVGSGVLADGWLREMPIGEAPAFWSVEPPGEDRALLELPLGPEWDAAATYRAVHHRRRVVNGVSGHEPPHYQLLQIGLGAQDPGVLTAIASLGPLDVVVNGAGDSDGGWQRYVAATPGAERKAGDGMRTLYRLAPEPAHAGAFGPTLPITTVTVPGNDAAARRALIDNDFATRWWTDVQVVDMSVTLDLGTAHRVSGVSQALAGWISDYPRDLVVETSMDGAAWTPGWVGKGLGPAIAGVMQAPRESRLMLPFTPREARLVRLRLASAAVAPWTIADVRVHGPDVRR